MSHIFSPYNISAHHHREHVRSNNISFVLMPGYSNPNDERKMEINPVAFRRKIFIYVYYYYFFLFHKEKKKYLQIMCLVRCLSQHTYRIPFRGKDKMKICLDVGDKLSSLLRGMNLSMSVASSACLHIKKHRIVSSSPRTFACLHNNDAKHNSFVRFAVVRFFADRNCEFILAAERKKNTHTQEVVYSMYVWLSHLRCSFCF